MCRFKSGIIFKNRCVVAQGYVNGIIHISDETSLRIEKHKNSGDADV